MLQVFFKYNSIFLLSRNNLLILFDFKVNQPIVFIQREDFLLHY